MLVEGSASSLVISSVSIAFGCGRNAKFCQIWQLASISGPAIISLAYHMLRNAQYSCFKFVWLLLLMMTQCNGYDQC